MKAIVPAFGLFFLSMLVFNDSMGQKAYYTSPGGITIGAGAGYAYQKSDLANSKGFGFDFTIGNPLFYRENAFLGIDWKFRFLAGENRAYDHRINPDYTYSNIRYSFFNYDLELGLTLNRLRERTGIVLTGFAGAGITHGRTFTDLYDAGNNLYDFESIDPGRDSKLVYKDLVNLSDGDFETRLVNRAAFLPTAGLFIGYRFSRSITLGIEYKTNFSLSEKNSFAGFDLDNRIISGSGIDRNNYVSLGFRWNLRGGASSQRAIKNYSTGAVDHYGNPANSRNSALPASLAHPSVRITDPSTEAYLTESPVHTLRATIENVSGPDKISFVQNGYPNNSFTYNANTKIFVANVRLNEGENRFTITAMNQGSIAEDLAIITLDHPREAENAAPSVEFTSPAANQVISPSERIIVTAAVKHIHSRQDIQLTVNGRITPFEYYPVSGTVKTSVLLDLGHNELLIKGFNESGSAQDQLTINAVKEAVIASDPIPVPEDDPVAHHPASYQPVAYQPVTHQPGNYQPVNHQPGNYQPVTYQPVTYQPGNSQPVNNGPVTHEPVSREPVSRESVSRESVSREPVSRERVTGVGVTREAATRERVTRERIIENPIASNPVTSYPVTSTPVTSNPVTSNPVTSNPVTSNPVTGNPVASTPVTSNPVTSGPVASNPATPEAESAIRINPGNDAWQFCMVTPSGSFSRENLTHANFSYSGQASSLYFMPTGGGGTARVNGKSYTIKSGQYYLFTGNINVSVGTNHPGSMGHWSVIVTADRQPVTGNGNNRPTSPCEAGNANSSKEKSNRR